MKRKRRLERLAGAFILILSAVAAAAGPAASPPGYFVLISIDACRPDYLDLAFLPHVAELKKTGTFFSEAWVGALESNTPPGHTEMSTGCFPKRNGIIGFAWRNSETGKIINPTTLEAVNNGDMARIIDEHGVPTLAGLVKRKWPAAKVAALSADKFYAAQGLGSGPTDFILYSQIRTRPASMPPNWMVPLALRSREPAADLLADPRLPVGLFEKGDENKIAGRMAVALLQRYRPRGLLINLPSTDVYGHQTGGIIAPDIMRQVIIKADEVIGGVMDAYRAEGIFEKTLWIVTADHGMIPNSTNLDIAAAARISRFIKATPDLEYPHTFLDDPKKAAALAEAAAQAHLPGVIGLYSKDEIGASKKDDFNNAWRYQPAPTTRHELPPVLNQAYLYLLRSCQGPDGPDVVAATIENALPGNIGGGPALNSHGAHDELTWGNQHIFMIWSGSGVRSGAQSTAPARLVDIAPTIVRILGLGKATMDGVVLADALIDPTASETSAQKTINVKLTPLRDAIKAAAQMR